MVFSLSIVTVNVVAVFFCLVLALLFARKRVFNIYFSLGLVDLAVVILMVSNPYGDLENIRAGQPLYYRLSYLFPYMLFPLFYFALRRLRQKPIIEKNPLYLLLTLPFLFLIFVLQGWGLDSGGAAQFVKAHLEFLFIDIHLLCSGVILVRELLQTRVSPPRSQEFELKLLNRIIIYLVFVILSSLIFDFVRPELNYLVGSPLLSLLIFGLIIYLAAQSPALLTRAAEKYKHSALSDESAQSMVDELQKILGEEKPYRDPGCTLPLLAEAMDRPVHYLSEAINKRLGLSFSALVNRYRIEEAKKLLAESDLKIIEVAFEVGFQTLPHFNRVFKKETGLTPSQFRKNKQ